MDLIDVSCGLIFDGQKVFVCRRKPEKAMGGYWEFPGGKVEASETGEACLVRELREELAMEVKVGQEFMANEHHYDHLKIRLIAYKCALVSFDGKLTDHDRYEWVVPSRLLEYDLAPADVPIAEAVIRWAWNTSNNRATTAPGV